GTVTSITLGVVAMLGDFTLFMVYKILLVRRRRPVIGDLIGSRVEAVENIPRGGTGFVRYMGEY
ncbi:MAG: nodulation protein NfeD, partial [Thermoproteota archaeon]